VISADNPYDYQTVEVLDSAMGYIDTGGEHEATVFLHGNPTTSYLWRNVIPHLEPVSRCLAIGDFEWTHWPPDVQALFKRFRSDEGEELVLQQNFFVEKILPAMVIGEVSEAVHNEYRRPFRNPGEDRRTTLTWPREIPIEGDPADVLRVITLMAISPNKPDESLSLIEKHELTFPVLSDDDNLVAKRFNLVFKMEQGLVDRYIEDGRNIAEMNGSEKWELPVPATYVIDTSGVIRYAFVSLNHRERAEPTEVIAVAASL